LAEERIVKNKLKEIGESLGFRTKSNFIVRPYPESWRFMVLDHVWLTSEPIEVPVIGFEVTMRGRVFRNTKKMKGDIVNLQLLNPRIGILVVNEKEAKEEDEKWYEEVDSFKKFLETIASPTHLEVLDIEDVMRERVDWKLILEKAVPQA